MFNEGGGARGCYVPAGPRACRHMGKYRLNNQRRKYEDGIQRILKRFNRLLTSLGFASVVVLTACGHVPTSTPTTALVAKEVTVVDLGAVVPNPVVTTITINATTISYSKGSVQWTKTIQSGDFIAVQTIISNNNLFATTTPVPPTGGECVGGRGINFTITDQFSNAHSFNVPGQIDCNTSEWPPGSDDLYTHMESLILLYS